MIALRDLDAEFLRASDAKNFRRVASIDEAHGVVFLCPKCFTANGGKVGTHSVICWSRSRGAPDDIEPLPGRWAMNGTGIDDLTLDADVGGNGARSVLLLGGCSWHGFINSGHAEGDC
jgi:hypothetical protein